MDNNAVVGYVAEKQAGRSPKPAIYRRREMRQREIAVTLLADMSTSIMQHLPEGGGRLVDRVRAGVLLFAESMEEVGDAYSIAGFCSKYRDNVSYYTIKGFEQRNGRNAAGRKAAATVRPSPSSRLRNIRGWTPWTSRRGSPRTTSADTCTTGRGTTSCSWGSDVAQRTHQT